MICLRCAIHRGLVENRRPRSRPPSFTWLRCREHMDLHNIAPARLTLAGRGGVEVRNLHASLTPVHALPTKPDGDPYSRGLRFHWLLISNAPLAKLYLKRSYLDHDPTKAMVSGYEIHQILIVRIDCLRRQSVKHFKST
jgi:hypothetical protein